ncbi:MAG: HD domain-containing phosphohydrolase [Vicinamibacterales bacterium]
MSHHPAPDARRPPALTPALRWYVGSVATAGAASIGVSMWALPFTPRPFEWSLIAAAGVLAGTYSLKIPGVDVRVSVSDTFFLALAVLFGPAPATVGMAVDSAILSWRRKYGWGRLLFNATGPPLSLWVATHAFFLLAGVQPLAFEDASFGLLILPLAATTAVWFLLNSWLIAVAVSLEAGSRAFDVWKRIAMLYANYAAAASASFCMVMVTRYAGLTAAAALLPLVFIFHLTIRSWLGRLDDAQQHVAKVDRLYLSTVETLATAIEAKDGVTHDHIRRVQIYAVGLARALGVSDDSTIKAIEAAALLHDTGKLAVPEHILNKPGKLTPTEFDRMKLHVDAGADILSAIEFPYPVVPIVRCHHESWDGTGYPRGVKGTDIPIGARILSVVDCFDALTSDRPYRRALSDEAAIAILTERRGTMYDPLVVDAFVRVLPEIAQRSFPPAPHREALAQISRAAASPAGTPAPPAPPPDLRSDAPDELLAFVSLARVVTAGSSFSDVLSLASAQLRRVLPDGTCAMYLLRDGGEELVVEHAAGPLAGALRGAVIRMSQKLTGWVAANRHTIVNSDAALDLADLVPDARRSCVSTPLVDGDALVGVLTIYADAPVTFTDAQGRMLQMVAPHLARMLTACRASAISVRTPAPPRLVSASATPELRVVSARQAHGA